MYRPRQTRLTRKRYQKMTKKILFTVILSVVFILLLFFYGIPLLIRMSIFIAELKKPGDSISKNSNVVILPPILEPTYEATYSAKIKIRGTAESGSQVEIYLNGDSHKEIVSDNDGDFSTSIMLTPGENRIIAIAKDKKGNESPPSETVFVDLKTTPPELVINKPDNDQKFSGEEEKEITIEGETDQKVTLYVNERLIIINQDGSFSTTYKLEEGDNNLQFTAYDNAGNTAKKDLKVSWKP